MCIGFSVNYASKVCWKKGKATENKTKKIIQLEGREAVEIGSSVLKQRFTILIDSWKQAK